MEINRCFGCMENITEYPCPKCGYDPEKNRPTDYVLHPGAILKGKYLLGRTLGQGGFGITYVGWDLALERKVAIKEYFPAGQVSRYPGKTVLQWYTSERSRDARQTGMEMFLKEARKMSRVDTIAEIVGVQDLFQENETAYIVMDFIEGETLKDRLKRTGPMGWEEAKLIFLPVAEAMEKVHQAGLIHRDISPDNLMLTPEGGVKILDLGAAKDLNLNAGASSVQVAKGGFSPLEQYTQRGGSGSWTDVYALAATLYYTLTGTVPPAAVDRVEEDNLRWDLPALAALPENVTAALKSALVLRTKERTQTMREFSNQLHKKRKKSRLPILATAAVLVLLVGGFVWRGVSNARQAEEKRQQALQLIQQGAYGEAIEQLDRLPQNETVERTRNEALYSWAAELAKEKDYVEALQKLELLTQTTEQSENLRKQSHYRYAVQQAEGFEARCEHFLAADNYSDAKNKLKTTKMQWINDCLYRNDLESAERFREKVQLSGDERQILFDQVGAVPFFTDENDSQAYIENALKVRKTLLADLPGETEQQKQLKTLVTLLTADNREQVILDNPELISDLWNMQAVRELATTGDTIYTTLSGMWRSEDGKYILFSNEDLRPLTTSLFSSWTSFWAAKSSFVRDNRYWRVFCFNLVGRSWNMERQFAFKLRDFDHIDVYTVTVLTGTNNVKYQLLCNMTRSANDAAAETGSLMDSTDSGSPDTAPDTAAPVVPWVPDTAGSGNAGDSPNSGSTGSSGGTENYPVPPTTDSGAGSSGGSNDYGGYDVPPAASVPPI